MISALENNFANNIILLYNFFNSFTKQRPSGDNVIRKQQQTI